MRRYRDRPLFTDPLEVADYIRHFDRYPTPQVSPYGIPGRCYRIALDYIPALVGLCEYYRWPDNHAGTPEQREYAAQMFCELQVLLMTGNIDCEATMALTKFRQNPTNRCIMEVSYDGGQTWETMFDYALCFRAVAPYNAAQVATAIAEATVYVNQQSGLYNGTPASIAPDMVHDSTPTDTWRDRAICMYIRDIIQVISAAAAARKVSGDGFFKELQKTIIQANLILIDVIVWLEDELSPFPDPIGTFLWDVIRNWQQEQLDNLNEDELEALQDPDVLQALQCYAYDRLEGATVTEAAFRGMFAGASGLDQVSNLIENYLTSAIDTEAAYVIAMSMLDVLPSQLENGDVVYDCPCAVWVADVTADMIANVDPYEAGGNAGATWNVDHWDHIDYKIDPTSAYYYRGISLKLEFPACLITKVEVADYTNLVFDQSTSSIWLDQSIFDNPKKWDQNATGYNISHVTPEFAYTTNRVNWWCNCDRALSIPQLNGLVRLHTFRLHGRGYNPFA